MYIKCKTDLEFNGISLKKNFFYHCDISSGYSPIELKRILDLDGVFSINGSKDKFKLIDYFDIKIYTKRDIRKLKLQNLKKLA